MSKVFDYSKIQQVARTALRGEVVGILGRLVVVKQRNPTWDDRPYVVTTVCHQPDSKDHEYSFHSSDYDLTDEQVRVNITKNLDFSRFVQTYLNF